MSVNCCICFFQNDCLFFFVWKCWSLGNQITLSNLMIISIVLFYPVLCIHFFAKVGGLHVNFLRWEEGTCTKKWHRIQVSVLMETLTETTSKRPFQKFFGIFGKFVNKNTSNISPRKNIIVKKVVERVS